LGEVFIYYLFGVVKICVELWFDDEMIVVVFFYDVVEDIEVGIDEVCVEFGDEIVMFVEGVMKLMWIQFQSREYVEVENYWKMIVVMVYDVWVILIKFVDWFYNMCIFEYLGC